MRPLILTVIAVFAVLGSQAVAYQDSQSLGRLLLRRALDAMSSNTGLNIKRRSMEDDQTKQNAEAIEDILSGSGSAQDASGDQRGDVMQSGDEGSGSGSAIEQLNLNDDSDVSGQSSGEQASADVQLQEEEASGEQADSGSASQASTSATQESQETGTLQVAETKKASSNEPITVVQPAKDEGASKKSEIELTSSEEPKEASSDGSASADNADEVTSGQAVEDEEDEHEDGSADAIKKGMESLSRLLKPVATTLDLQVYSGSAKPKEDADEEEEQKAVIKEVAKGESDKEEEEQDVEKEAPVKLKKCETVCKAPLTFQQCAVPRCSKKMGTIKDLCFYLCEHQKPHCEQVCKEVE